MHSLRSAAPGNAMRHPITATLTAIACLGIALPGAGAQTARDLVGTWALESDTTTTPDGRTIQPFGPQPSGIAIFDSSGRFAIVNSRPDLPKFASNNRMRGTAAENEAIVHGSFAFFGTYSVANGVIVQHIEGGTWPAWNGTDQKRTISSFTANEQTWTTVPSFGGRSELHWKRMK
ncbi:MAG TPA: lipocalin-like domain-containing protein [Xanthobacteraceae bacterium]|nr:lipocalin-like domain-containing protein [Xanthobacteraceae bacterium]